MHSRDSVRHVFALAEHGSAIPDIADSTGIPRATVQRWLGGAVPRFADGCDRCGAAHDLDALPGELYAYAFGMYLGDGCLLRHPRGVWRLEVTLDSQYPRVIAECADAV